MRILKFDQFLNESSDYEIPGVKSTWGGGYEIQVKDITDDEDQEEENKILFKNDNGTSASICYIDSDGELIDPVSIPLDAIELKKDNTEKVNCIVLDPYKKWITLGKNSEAIDDFIESFGDCMSDSKSKGTSNRDSAKDDVEMILDLLGISSDVDHFSNDGENKWAAALKNGSLVEINKRSKNDLLGSFKVYRNHKDAVPCIHIDHSCNPKLTKFNLGDDIDLEEEFGLTDLRMDNPYHKFLIKKSLGQENSEDKENLIDHFRKCVGSNNSKNPEEFNKDASLKKMMKALGTFLPKQEIQDIYYPRK